jgi:hypothetical protein
MQTTYTHIATFQYSHEYYLGKGRGLFHLKIPKETQKSLLNLNLIIKPFESGFHLLSGDRELLQNEQKSLRFHFEVKDPLFWNYTDLEGFYPQRNLIFYSNTVLKGANDSETKGVLIDHDALYEIHRGKKFPLDLSNSQNPITVFDEMGNSVVLDKDKPQKDDIEEEGSFTIPSDPDQKRIYIFPDQLFMLPDMVFALNPAKLFEDSQSISPVVHQINFKARATKWRYIITDPDLNKLPIHGIQNSKNANYSFTDKQIEINGLGMMRCFESDQTILLQEPSPVDFQLIGKPDPDSVPNPEIEFPVIIKHLPVASPEYIYQENSSPNEFYTQIFI